MSDFNEAHQNYLKLKELGLVEQYPETSDALVSVFKRDCAQGQAPFLAPEPEPAGLLPQAEAENLTEAINNGGLVCPLEEFFEARGHKPNHSTGLVRIIRELYKKHFNEDPKLKRADPSNNKAPECNFLVPKKWLDEQWPALEIQHPSYFEEKNPTYGSPIR